MNRSIVVTCLAVTSAPYNEWMHFAEFGGKNAATTLQELSKVLRIAREVACHRKKKGQKKLAATSQDEEAAEPWMRRFVRFTADCWKCDSTPSE